MTPPARIGRLRLGRAALAFAMATLAASTLAGCGSSSELTLSGPVRAPTGYGIFHGPWFTMILPSNWPASVTPQGPHTAFMSVLAPGAGDDTTHGGTTTLKLPRIDIETMTTGASASRQTYDQALARLKGGALLPLSDGNYLKGKAAVATVHVAGANQARLVSTEDTTFALHAMTLVVLAPAGVTYVDVVWTGRATLLDPTAIIHSFRVQQ